VILWRIAAETRKHSADDLGGKGAASHPGRWNEEGQPVVYAAPTLAMAVLETAAHIDDGGLPLNRFVVRIDVTEAVWAARDELPAAALPVGWAAIPAGRASVKVGSDWIRSLRSAILLVPSVIVPEEWVALINPAHTDAKGIAGKTVRPFEYARLFRPG
jgi:RES domain-containing protein